MCMCNFRQMLDEYGVWLNLLGRIKMLQEFTQKNLCIAQDWQSKMTSRPSCLLHSWSDSDDTYLWRAVRKLSGPLYPKLSTSFEGARLTQLVQLVTPGRLFLGHKGRVDPLYGWVPLSLGMLWSPRILTPSKPSSRHNDLEWKENGCDAEDTQNIVLSWP